MIIVNDINFFANHDKDSPEPNNYVLSSHGEDNGLIFNIPNNIYIVLYEELGKEIVCKDYMPNLICGFQFEFNRNNNGEFKEAYIFEPGEKFPNLHLWRLKTAPNYVKYPSGIIKCGNGNPVVYNIDRLKEKYHVDTNLQTIVEKILNIEKENIIDEYRIYIHVLACTVKGNKSIYASAKKINKKIKIKIKTKKTKKTKKIKKIKNKKIKNKKIKNKITKKSKKL